MMQSSDDSGYVISYMMLRKATGIIGIALPVVLVAGKILLESPGIQSSISSYYYTVMRDVFVGSLCAIAVFLMSYKGPGKNDDLAGNLACIFALGVALFPTEPALDPTPHEKLVGTVHYMFSAAFFSMLAYFCLGLFRRTSPDRKPTPRKLLRNKVYKICGYTIIFCIVMIGMVSQLSEGSPVKQLSPVFWFESLAIWAFGWSWFTKGEGILKDL